MAVTEALFSSGGGKTGGMIEREEALKMDPISPTGKRQTESRRHRRRAAKPGTRVSCRLGSYGLGAELARSVVDLSEGGACITLTARIDPGQEVEITLDGPGGQRSVRLPARVAWCDKAPDGGYWAGLEFEKYLAYRDLTELTLE
jgi:hypothetical protein